MEFIIPITVFGIAIGLVIKSNVRKVDKNSDCNSPGKHLFQQKRPSFGPKKRTCYHCYGVGSVSRFAIEYAGGEYEHPQSVNCPGCGGSGEVYY